VRGMGLRNGALTTDQEQKDTEAIIMGRNTPNRNRNDQTTADQTLADGLDEYAAMTPSIVVGGAPMQTRDIAAALQARIVAARAVTSSRATWQAAVQAEREERAKTKALVSVVKQTLLASFAGQVDTLARFGLTPRKPRVVSPDTQVAAAAKAKATRAARHTMGKRQKAEIKGVAGGAGAPVVDSTANELC
jgi:hypothetical protein